MCDEFDNSWRGFDMSRYTEDEWHAMKQAAQRCARRERSKAIRALIISLLRGHHQDRGTKDSGRSADRRLRGMVASCPTGLPLLKPRQNTEEPL